MDESPEPLALSPEQIITDEEEDEEPVAALSFEDILGNDDDRDEPAAFAGEAELVDPEDIAFASDDEAEAKGFPESSAPVEEPAAAPRPAMPIRSEPPPAARPMSPQSPPGPAPSVAHTAPMPDPTLSSDMAEQLLEPTTKSAVKHAFSRLNGLSTVAAGVTLEDMMRDMLRPMLKEWLDENLPSIVERMVEKEIARISRGIE
jgi:cell pole-organizing protein PopZ